MNGNGIIDLAGSDRVTFTTNDVVSDNATDVHRTRTYVWSTSADAPTLLSTTESSVDGLQSWNTIWNNGVGATTHSQTAYNAASGYSVVTTIAPDDSFTITTNQYGRSISVSRKDSNGTQIGQTTFSYDPHGRQNTVTDARNGAIISYFNAADQATASVTPSPDGIQSPQVTTNILDIWGGW